MSERGTPPDRGAGHAMGFVLATVFLDAMGIGLIFPVMPALLTEVTGSSLGGAALWGGLISTAFAVMQFLCGPLVGNLSDRFGRRPVLLASLAVMALDYVVMALAHSVWLLLLGRVVAGAASATHATANAFVADISAPDDRARRFGLIGAAFGAGFVAGPVLGGLAAGIDPRAPFWAAAALAAGNLAFGALVLPETLPRPRAFRLAEANPLASLAALRRLPGLRLLLGVMFLYAITFAVWPAIWSFYGTAAFGWDARWIGLSLAVFGLAMAAAQALLVQPAISRLGERRTAILGMMFEVCSYSFYALVTSGIWALALTPLTALGGLTGPALGAMMSRRTPEDRQGELQGVNASINALAMILAPLIFTAIFDYFTGPAAPVFWPGAPMMVSALLMVVAMAVFVAGTRDRAG